MNDPDPIASQAKSNVTKPAADLQGGRVLVPPHAESSSSSESGQAPVPTTPQPTSGMRMAQETAAQTQSAASVMAAMPSESAGALHSGGMSAVSGAVDAELAAGGAAPLPPRLLPTGAPTVEPLLPWWRRWLSRIAVVLIAALLAVYWVFVATERFVSEARFLVRSEKSASPMDVLSGMGLSPSGASQDPNRQLLAFISSADCLAEVDARCQIVRHWQDSAIDPWTRLAADATREAALVHWRSRVTARWDEATGLLFLEVQAHSPIMAASAAAAILAACERISNQMSQQLIDARRQALESETERARIELDAAIIAWEMFQTRHGILDVGQESAAIASQLAALEQRRTAEGIALAEERARLAEQSEPIQRLVARLRSLDDAIFAARVRLMSGTGADAARTPQLISESQRLQSSVKYRQDLYAVVLSGAQAAQAEQRAVVWKLITIAAPRVPDEARLPARFSNAILAVIFVLSIYCLNSLILHAIREFR